MLGWALMVNQAESWPRASMLPRQGKNYAGATQNTSKTSGFQESSQCRGGQNQETPETKECTMKEQSHFVDL